MLQVWEIQDRTQIKNWLESLDIQKQTWLLSDLRTKFEIQDHFLEKRGFFLDDSVLRISDLWKKILLRCQPEYRIVTPQATRLHLRFFLRSHAESLGLPESSENTLMKWMTDLAPLYFHPNGEEKLQEWFASQSDQNDIWRDWWLRSKAAFSYFESKKLLMAPWVSSFLQREMDISNYWEKDLCVDMGSQLTYVEAELLHQISRKKEVVVLQPTLSTQNHEKYRELLKPYEYLKGFSHQVTSIEYAPHQVTQDFQAYSSSLGAIRDATAQVRQWIEAGIPPHQIAVVAPDIESVWPTLAFHFESEGIPMQKSHVSSLQALVDVQKFLSKIRTIGLSLSTRDLELAYYEDGQAIQMNDLAFERFEALYKNIYDEKDYSRFDKIKIDFANPQDLSKPLSQDQFLFKISQLNSFYSSASDRIFEVPSWMEALVRDILSSFEESMLMPWNDWVSFSESSLSRHELNYQEAQQQGVMITSLMSSHFLNVTHRVFIELSEESMKAKSDRGIMPQSARLLARDLGFWLTHSEQGDTEFELEWAAQCGKVQDKFYFSATQLTGQIQTPSSIWLKLKSLREHKVQDVGFQVPRLTVLDHTLNQQIQNPRLLQDLGEQEYESLQGLKIKSISPSALEAFYRCPFVYYARQTLHLKTFPEIDLDVDRRSVGEAIHFLFETILSKDLLLWSEASLELLLEESRLTHFSYIVQGFWGAQKKKMVKLCLRFIEFEKEWRKKHPYTQKTMTEVQWKGTLKGNEYQGRMDRVDISDRNQMIVLDYKLSGSQLKGAHQWIESGSLQMLFYIYALEHGWAEGLEGHVVAAFYYVIKNFAREVGFETKEEIPQFFHPTSKRNQKYDEEQKTKLMNQFEELTESLASRLKKGEMKPIPEDEKSCARCEWRRLCRAPHLN